MLEKRDNFLGEYFVPLIVDSKNDIWAVGDFCYTLYFNKQRMKGLGFDFFYKVYIERKVSKLNLKDLYDIANQNGELTLQSGKQELFEAIVNMYI